jgi:hypothetical protein
MKRPRFDQLLTVMVVFWTIAHAMPARSEQSPAKAPSEPAADANQPSPPAAPEGTRRGQTGRAGNTQANERTISGSLRWLFDHQNADGSWRFDPPADAENAYANPGAWKSDSGATALALLPFFAAGQTQKTIGPYRATIASALQSLIKQQKPNGDLSGGGSPKMLSHGLAAVTLCEAYGLSGDKTVGAAAQQAINFIVASQNENTGGWAEPSGQPAMSVSAWQLMALTSGSLAGLEVPAPALKKAAKFLDSLQAKDGAKYGESKARGASDAATIMGLLAGRYLGSRPAGVKEDAGEDSGVKWLSERGLFENDAISNVWATIFMHKHPGDDWNAWNRNMRKQLIATQIREGDESGSWWNPRDVHAPEGGRLFQTAMNALTLEVYYRYLPLFKPLPKDIAPANQ